MSRRRLTLPVIGFIVSTLLLPGVSRAADTDQIRFYIAMRLGASFFTDTQFRSDIEVPGVGRSAVFSGGAGLNLGRYVGLEVAFDLNEADLNLTSGEKIGEYSIATIIPQVRLRYPLANGRLTPYVVGGAGWAFTEFNDPAFAPFQLDKRRETTLAGAVGGGIEYFVAYNIAIGVEAKFLFLRDVEFRIRGSGTTEHTDLDTVLLTVGLRIFFP